MNDQNSNKTNCNNTTEVGNNYVVDKLIEQSKSAAVMEERKDRMAAIYKERGVKLRDAELEVSNQKMSLLAKDTEIARLTKLNEKGSAALKEMRGKWNTAWDIIENIASLCNDSGATHEHQPTLQKVYDLVKAYSSEKHKASKLNAEKRKLLSLVKEQHVKGRLRTKQWILNQYNAYLNAQAKKLKAKEQPCKSS